MTPQRALSNGTISSAGAIHPTTLAAARACSGSIRSPGSSSSPARSSLSTPSIAPIESVVR